MITKAIAANNFHRDESVVDSGNLAVEGDGVIGVPRHTQSQADRPDDSGGPGPIGDEALYQTGVGEDVDENVLGPLGLRLVAVMVDILVIAGRDCR